MKVFVRNTAIQIDEADLPLIESHKWTVATMPSGHRYVRACIHNKAKNRSGVETIYLHRLICGLQPGQREVVDHINGDTLNNTRQNLRVTTQQKNSINRKLKNGGAHQSGNGYWMARITVAGKQRYLGCFKTKEAAQARYSEEAVKVHGAFARNQDRKIFDV